MIADLQVERDAELEIPIDIDVETIHAQLETWQELETDQPLEVSFIVPILLLGEPFSSISLDNESQFYLTELGSDYFCFSEDEEVRSSTTQSACITFYNIAEIQAPNNFSDD